MKGAVVVLQAGESEPDRIVGIDREFGAGGASERLFAQARPVDLLPSKWARLDRVERAIQVCTRVWFRGII
jgi:hypothetical protein